MRKNVLVLLGLALLMCGTALAQQQYSGGLLTNTDFGTSVYNRLYHPGNDLVSPGGDTNCPAAADFYGFDAATRSCNSKLKSPTSGAHGYKAYFEDIANDQKPAGDVRYLVFDAELNVGAANHTGYYFFAGKAVNIGDLMSWNGQNCAGTAASTCLGQGTGTNAAGTDVANSPLGTIAPIDGFRPIPVPTVTGWNKTSGDITLTWRTATDVNGIGTVTYDVYGVNKATCTAPLASEYTKFIRTVSGTTTTVNTQTDFATAPTVSQCYYFALKLRFPNAGVTPVVSRYFSANGQGVAFGGAASTVTNIKAVRTGNAIAVSWNTSLEDGLKGFYVMRSFTENGTYERVSGLIAAKGQPSSYTFVDTKAPMGQVRGTGVYYKVQTSDIDNNVQAFGPVKAELGMGQGPVQREQRQQTRENKTQRAR